MMILHVARLHTDDPSCCQVWDGRFSAAAAVSLLLRDSAPDSGLRFSRPVYAASVPENSARMAVVTVVSAVGHAPDEPLRYALLNGGGRFWVRPSCGVVMTSGVPLDREAQDAYELVLEVSRHQTQRGSRVARVTVWVQVSLGRGVRVRPCVDRL